MRTSVSKGCKIGEGTDEDRWDRWNESANEEGWWTAGGCMHGVGLQSNQDRMFYCVVWKLSSQ
jgi:hypothetical protein